MKIFGVGMMKTGTSTLATCFKRLGYNHQPFYPKLTRQIAKGDLTNVWPIVDEHDTFEDNPWPMIYRELDERYPDAKFVLTTRRDSETWWRSMTDHAKRMGPIPERKIIYGHAWPFGHKVSHIRQYEEHNDGVRQHFADRPGKLLDICWETGSSWQDLTDFLDRDPLPQDTAVPRANAKSDQGVHWNKWVRNSGKTLMISTLRYDPFMYHGFNT